MKLLMSSDSDTSAVKRTKAPLPLCEVWFISEEPERVFERQGVHLLYFAIYFSWGGGGGVDGYLAADKNPSEHRYRVASGHSHLLGC